MNRTIRSSVVWSLLFVLAGCGDLLGIGSLRVDTPDATTPGDAKQPKDGRGEMDAGGGGSGSDMGSGSGGHLDAGTNPVDAPAFAGKLVR